MDGWDLGKSRNYRTLLQSLQNNQESLPDVPAGSKEGKPREWGRMERKNKTWEGTGICPRMLREPREDSVCGMFWSWIKVRGVCNEVLVQKLNWPSRSQVPYVDFYPLPIWEALGIKLNILSKQTPRLILTLCLKQMSGVWPELGRGVEMFKVSINLFSAMLTAPPPFYSPIYPPINLSSSNGLVARRWRFAAGGDIFWNSDKRWILGMRWKRELDYLCYGL